MSQSTLAAALSYLERGWSAIPLCPFDHQGVNGNHQATCTKPGKVPLWPWKTYQERLAKPAELKMYWTRNPNCNVGIAMGSVSNLVGLDIDGAQGEKLLDHMSAGDIVDTLEFTTPGGGRRLLFRWPSDGMPIKTFPVDGKEALRILAQGSQTAAPPSRHASGGEYVWTPGRGPGEIEPAECPHWLLQAIQDPEGDDQVGCGVGPKSLPIPSAFLAPSANENQVKRAQAYLDKCEPCNPLPDHPMDASTHHLKIATAMAVGFALPIETAVALIGAWDKKGNPKPWPEKEIFRKCEEALQNSTKPMGYLLQEDDAKPIKMETTSKPTDADSQAFTKPFQAIEMKTVEWLWKNWLPLGKIAMLDGDPGLGKSTLLLDLAARVSLGGVMPDGTMGIAGSVIIMSAEDAPEDTIRPRLDAAGANLAKIFDLSHVVENGNERPPEIPKDLPLLARKVKELEARLLIIDPLMAFLYGADANKDQEIRRVLFKISKIAEKNRCAVIAMRHLNKGSGQKAIYRGNSSIGVIGHARTGLLVAQDPDDEHKRILAVSKCNLALKPKSLRFALDPVGEVCRIGWCGSSEYGADQLVSQPASEEEKEKKEDAKTKVQQAKIILEKLLQEGDGKMEVKPAKMELAAAGLTGGTVDRAVKEMHLKVSYITQPEGGRRYYWTVQYDDSLV